jgi:hypothetical protein
MGRIQLNTPRPEPPTKVKKRRGDEWICPKHGPMCIPGICAVRARVVCEERWQKEREERAENKRKWIEWKERKARKREMKLARECGRITRDTRCSSCPSEEKDLSNTYRTPHQVRCASVLKVPTLLRLLRKSVRRRLFRQREKDFLCQPTWAENTRSPKVQSSSAQARGIGAGDGIEIGIETGIQ